MKCRLISLLALGGSLLVPSLASAQDDTVPPDVDVPAAGPIHDLIQQYRDQYREMNQDYLEARRALRERLANATEEERRRLVAEFRETYRDHIQEQRELRRELRRQIHELRREHRRDHRGDGTGDGIGNGG